MNKVGVVKLEVSGWLHNGTRAHPRAGTGFIIYSEKPYTIILTAAHVLGSKTEWDDDSGKSRRTIRVEALDGHGKLEQLAADARVHSQNDSEDWAILLIEGQGYPCFEIGDPQGIVPGATGVLIGYEADSRVPGYAEGKITSTNVENYGFVVRINMNVVEGQSGSPVLDERGRVLGIASNNEIAKLGYHIAVPVTLPAVSLRSLLSSAGTMTCGSAERQVQTLISNAQKYQILGKQTEYIASLEDLVRNEALLRALADASRLEKEVKIRLEIAFALMMTDYQEGISANNQRALAHLEKARLLAGEHPIVLALWGYARASEAAERSPIPNNAIVELRSTYTQIFEVLAQKKRQGYQNEDSYDRDMVIAYYWYGRSLRRLQEYSAARTEWETGLALAEKRMDVEGMPSQREQYLFKLGENEFAGWQDRVQASKYWKQLSDDELSGQAAALFGFSVWVEGQVVSQDGDQQTAIKKYREAEKILAVAKQLGHRSWRLSFRLGMLYFSLEDYVNAASNFEEATLIDSTRDSAFYWLGRSILMIADKDRFPEARVALFKASELAARDPNNHYWLGRVLMHFEEYTAAENEFEKSVSLNGKNIESRRSLIEAMIQVAQSLAAGSPQQSTVHYEKALKQANSAATVADSQHDVNAAFSIHKLRSLIWNALAYKYAERDDFKIAEHYIEKALQHSPNDPNYLDTKAWVIIRKTELSGGLSPNDKNNRLILAEQTLNQAIDLFPEDADDLRAESIFHLGYIERLRGNEDQARRLFLQALEVNPENTKAKDALRRL